ncbi:MAG: NIPSNAP family protein [Chitinophagaceae bacterium]|nr:MAG: NIPSNAP family protein [Chitinophagaceae bacterium]
MNCRTLLIALLFPILSIAQQKDTKMYELRVYYCHPGKLDDLVKRFTDHTAGLFEKHGMVNVGYWIPVDNQDNALYYVLSFPNRESRDKSWAAFNNDPVWKDVAKKSEESGKIIKNIVSTFMSAAPVSPAITKSSGKTDRSFELRTYTPEPGRLDELVNRFKNHSIALLKKHGATHIAYWITQEEPEAPSKLIYMLAFPSVDQGKASWDAFRKDPEWIKAKAESEKDHPIVQKTESIFMKPTSFSTIR